MNGDNYEGPGDRCYCRCGCERTVDGYDERCSMCSEFCLGNVTARAEAAADRHERLNNRVGKVEGVDP